MNVGGVVSTLGGLHRVLLGYTPVTYRTNLNSSCIQSTLPSPPPWLSTWSFNIAHWADLFPGSPTSYVLSCLSAFACVLSCACYACHLLVILANFSFSFISKFKHHLLCDTFSDSLLSGLSCLSSTSNCVHSRQGMYGTVLWNWSRAALRKRAQNLMQVHTSVSLIWNVINDSSLTPLRLAFVHNSFVWEAISKRLTICRSKLMVGDGSGEEGVCMLGRVGLLIKAQKCFFFFFFYMKTG